MKFFLHIFIYRVPEGTGLHTCGRGGREPYLWVWAGAFRSPLHPSESPSYTAGYTAGVALGVRDSRPLLPLVAADDYPGTLRGSLSSLPQPHAPKVSKGRAESPLVCPQTKDCPARAHRRIIKSGGRTFILPPTQRFHPLPCYSSSNAPVYS